MLIKKCNCYRNIGKKILICKKKTLGHLCTVKKNRVLMFVIHEVAIKCHKYFQ